MRHVTMLSVLMLAVMLAVPSVGMAAPPVDLLTTSNFAVLAGSTITNANATTITGDVGLHPGTSVTGFGTVTLDGAMHVDDAVALQAKTDLVTAYDQAAGSGPVTEIPTELGGGNTLTAGVYDSASGDFQITGSLTLDAQGDPEAVFIFLTDSTLITASNSVVNLVNGARFCRVFWKVGSSATLGSYSQFTGHIFALTSITANSGATVEGQLLARNGAVTLDNNVITNGVCASARDIEITKQASPTSLPVGGGAVTYTYTVTNPGTFVLSSVSVTDDMVSPVTYVSGDVNDDDMLQPGETWIYTATADLTATTTNTATATGSSNNVTATDTAIATVVVAGSDTATTTPTGGLLPDTATPWYNVLLAGFVLALLGAVGLAAKRIYG